MNLTIAADTAVPVQRPDYHAVYAVTDPAYRCEYETAPGRMCLAPAEFSAGVCDPISHALYADVVTLACAAHLAERLRADHEWMS